LPSSQLKKLTVIPDNTATSAIDSKTDANLSGDSPLTVSTLNELTGIPATGPGSITVDLPKSYNIRLFVQRDDTVAQAALAAVEGGDGIHEYPIDDSTIPTVAAANARGDAELALFAYVDAKPTISTRDYKAAAGRLATISTSQISGSFRIQSVRISQIGMLTVGVTSTTAALSGKYHYPLRVVECSTARVTLQAILRSMVLSQSGPKTSS
jgi:hypothetical protein